MGEKMSEYGVLVGKPEERERLEYLDVDEITILHGP